jgi:hypothetical protein
LLFTSRCTSVQVLGEKLGQSDLSRHGRVGTHRRRDVAHARASLALGVRAPPAPSQGTLRIPEALKVHGPRVAPTRAAGRATDGPSVHPRRFPLFTCSYRGSPPYVALMPRCPSRRGRGAAPHLPVAYLRVAPFSSRATGHPPAPPRPSRPSTHS